MLKFYEIVSLIIVFQFILVSLFLVFQKRGRQLCHYLLAGLLLSMSVFIFHFITWIYRVNLYVQCPHVFYVGSSFIFLFGPLLYFYVVTLLDRNFTFRIKHAVHLVPFILHGVYLTLKYHVYDAETKRHLLSASLFSSTEECLFRVLFSLLALIYLIASLRVYRKNRSHLLKEDPSGSYTRLSWLRFVIVAFIIIWTVRFFEFILWVASINDMLFVHPLFRILIFIFANVLVYEGLKHPQLFSDVEIKKRHKNNVFSEKQKEMYLKRLVHYMEYYKPHLESSLTLSGLADRLCMPSRHVSQIINESFQSNFFHFINRYRIEEAKQRLLDFSSCKKNILQILLEVGFNSKSVFNRAFKTYTGMTPSEFKKLHRM
jgi:AraC-like DNA-binding protein